MLRVFRDYDALWLTLLAWAIFVLSFSTDAPRYVHQIAYVAIFTPPLLSFAAVVYAFSGPRRIDTLVAVIATLSCLMQFLFGVFE